MSYVAICDLYAKLVNIKQNKKNKLQEECFQFLPQMMP